MGCRVRSAGRASKGLLCAVLLFSAAIGARAGASLPYTPSWKARHHLERLVDEAGMPLTLSHWPLPGAAVRAALQALPGDLPPALSDARDEVLADLERVERPLLTLRAKSAREALVGFDDDYVPGASVALRSGAIDLRGAGADWLAAGIGARIEQQAGSLLGAVAPSFGAPAALGARLDDSALVAQWEGVNLQVYAQPHWWSPAWQSSLVLGNNAPAWVGAGLQRAQVLPSTSPWLAWLGAWNMEYFVAQARDPLVALGQPRGFLFVGARLTVRPHRLVEFAVTRTWQTGGSGRQRGWRPYLSAMLGRGTNPPGPEGANDDPGNEMGGFDLRVGCGAVARCAFYAQAIGEDQARYVPTKYLALFGAESWSADGRQRWFAEYAHTSCHSMPWEREQPNCAYRNYQYPQGYTNGGRWAGASIGPDSRVVTLGWYAPADERRVRVHVGRIGASLGGYAPDVDAPRGRLVALGVEQAVRVGRGTLTGTLNWTHLRAGTDIGANRRVDTQFGAVLAWPLDGVGVSGPARGASD